MSKPTNCHNQAIFFNHLWLTLTCQLSLAVTTFAWLGFAMTPASAASFYSITDLHNFGGKSDFIAPRGINNKGQVVGIAETASGDTTRAFLYSDNKLQNLGTFGGPDSSASGINDKGQVVGTSATARGAFGAFLYSNGTLKNLGVLGSEASSINNKSQVVGSFSTANGEIRPFLYSDGKLKDLGTFGGSYSDALGINNKGQVVGTSTTASGAFQAFLYSDGKLKDLGTLGGYPSSVATAINNKGQVVGTWDSASGDTTRAFLYSGDKLKDLGTLGGNYAMADGINDKGQVVGTSRNASGDMEAFLYDDGKLQNLNSLISPKSGVSLSEAYGINDIGQIIASGSNGGIAFDSAYLLTPESPVPVPEPSSALGTLIFGALSAGWMVQCKLKKSNLA